MNRKRTKHSGMFRAGLAVAFVGVILGITGVAAGPAGAAKPDTFKITLCHRTNAPTNPYRIVEVSVDATNGKLVGPDHTGHDGPAFDFTLDPSAQDYPYTTPRNGDQWGDRIPPYDYGDGGHFDGMNWPDGTTAGDCQGPDEPEDPSCPAGQVWDDVNENDAIDQGECLTEIECPEGTDWVDANQNGFEEEGECTTPFACPEGTTFVDANQNSIEEPDECEQPTVFACPEGTDFVDGNGNAVEEEGECVTPAVPEVPETPDVQVEGAVITPPAAATLPVTGSSTGPLAAAGFGLILAGVGAMGAARRKMASIGR